MNAVAVLKKSPHPESIRLLSDLFEGGRYAEVETQAYDLLALFPDDGSTWTYLGACLQKQGKNALAVLKKGAELSPDDPIALNNLGNDQRQIGQLSEAIQTYRLALKLNPDAAEIYCNLGIALQDYGHLEEAVENFRNAIKLKPDFDGFHSSLGVALEASGLLAEAVGSYRRALEINPRLHEIHHKLGVLLFNLEEMASAEQSFSQTLILKPDFAAAHCNIGSTYLALGRLLDAEKSYRIAISLQANFAEAHCNLGTTLKYLGKLDEALINYQRTVVINAEYADGYGGMADTLRILGRYDEAQRCYLLALHFNPDCVETQMGQSAMYLQRGDFEVGWLKYECRWKQKNAPALRFDGSLWLGKESVAEKTIILCVEQGLGDMIQFARFASVLADMGARVILAGPDSLKRLMLTVRGINQVITPGETLPQHDFYCPLLSLPLALRITQEAQIPASLPYLAPSGADVHRWASKIGPSSQRLRVGIAWAGNPAFRRDQQRSIAFETLGPLFEIDGIDFYSLQKGEVGAAELAASSLKNKPIDVTGELHDFADTAALLANLDLVITIDSAVAHLAGAMGKRVWLLNRYDTCWRWMLARDDSPWYPGVIRIFRQSVPGQWQGVIDEVVGALRQEQEAKGKATKIHQLIA